MKYPKGIISLLLLSLALSFGTLPVSLAADDAVHVVAKGETAYSISRMYKVSMEELMRYNNIADASKLQAGKRLRIPPGAVSIPTRNSAAGSSTGVKTSPASTGGTSTAQAGWTEYRVVKNDTLYSLAQTHRVTVNALRDINSFPSGYVLKEGERIKIPGSSASGTTAPLKPIQPAPRETSARTTVPAAIAAETSLRWPVAPKSIAYMSGKLYGVVLLGERSESVRSIIQGTVISAGPYRGFGKVAIIQVSGGYLYVYGGCESLSVKEGDRIGPGTELGKLGIDAVSGKPQLFFMVYRGSSSIDPAKAPRA